MSMCNWTCSGYGITRASILASDILKYCQKEMTMLEQGKYYMTDQIKELISKVRDNPDEYGEGQIEECLMDITDERIFDPVATILNAKYATRWFEACPGDDEDQSDALLYMPGYPWQMDKGDKAMTEEHLDEIYGRLLNDMRRPELKSNIGDQILYYCG